MKTTLILALIVVCLSGCSVNSSKESLTIPITIKGQETVLTWSHKDSSVLFLYFTKYKEVESITPFSSLTVGEIESVPDANSVEAFGAGLIEGLKMF